MVSVVTDKGYHAGREPANKGRSFPVEVLTDEEVKKSDSSLFEPGADRDSKPSFDCCVVPGRVAAWRGAGVRAEGR